MSFEGREPWNIKPYIKESLSYKKKYDATPI